MTYGNYPDLTKVKKVLVVKMRHLGDVLLTSPVFSSLKQAMPDADIDAYIYSESLPMLEGHPAISNFILYERSWKKLSFFQRLRKELSMLRKIRKERYDLVVNLTEGDRGAIAAYVAKSPIRIGFDPGKKGLIGKKKLYTHMVKNCNTPRHTVERLLDIVRCLGIFPSTEDRSLTFVVPRDVKAQMTQRLGEKGIEKGRYLLVHPVSRWLFKSPPPGLFAQVIEKFNQDGVSVVLTSGPASNERALCDRIMERLPSDAQVLDLSGKTTLKELGALIMMSQALLTVDSVPLHMASALKAPVVVLFGPSNDLNWGPWQHDHGVVIRSGMSCEPCGRDGCGGSKYSDCLFRLDPSEIYQAAENMMSTSTSSSPSS